MKPLSWQSVVLLLGVFVLSLGTAIWLVHSEGAPQAILLVPIGGFMTAAFGALGGYLKGLVQMPPGLEGAEIKIVQTLPPPPSAAVLMGERAAPPGEVARDVPPVTFDEDTTK